MIESNHCFEKDAHFPKLISHLSRHVFKYNYRIGEYSLADFINNTGAISNLIFGIQQVTLATRYCGSRGRPRKFRIIW